MKKWLKAAGIRALKTMAQSAVAAMSTSVMIEDINWRMVLSVSILSGILSICTSFAGLPEVKEDEYGDSEAE
ncbi:MAG: holin [Oscillospiraceae bacterium]|nr:holin [Oscillospiraceae bacterium]